MVREPAIVLSTGEEWVCGERYRHAMIWWNQEKAPTGHNLCRTNERTNERRLCICLRLRRVAALQPRPRASSSQQTKHNLPRLEWLLRIPAQLRRQIQTKRGTSKSHKESSRVESSRVESESSQRMMRAKMRWRTCFNYYRRRTDHFLTKI